MALVISPRNILLVVTICVIQMLNCEDHCESRDLRVLVQHVRQLRTDFQQFKDATNIEIKELKSTMEKELDVLRKMIPQNNSCPEDWKKNGNSCYYIAKSSSNFTEAQEFCKNRSANVVHVNDATDNDFLSSFMKEHGGKYFWIGLTEATEGTCWFADSSNNKQSFNGSCSYTGAYPLCEKFLN